MCIAFPGRVVAIDPAGALVETEGRLRRASTLLVDGLVIGDWVTVAAGTVLARLEPAEADEIQAILRGTTRTPGQPIQPSSTETERTR
jgi:hydrogenase expression/formation protein HypC